MLQNAAAAMYFSKIVRGGNPRTPLQSQSEYLEFGPDYAPAYLVSIFILARVIIGGTLSIHKHGVTM